MDKIGASMSPESRHSFQHTLEVSGLVFAAGLVLNLLAGWNWGITLMVTAVVIPLATWRNIHRNGGMSPGAGPRMTAHQ